MTMPHGTTIDLWHLALFTPGVAVPCILAYLAGVAIERRGLHPPLGWILIVAFVPAAVFAGILTAALLALVVALQLACGYAGARIERDRIAIIARLERDRIAIIARLERDRIAIDARIAALEARSRPT